MPIWSDEQREIARLRVRLETSRRHVRLLHNLLRVIRDCTERRCHLCGPCLNAAWEATEIDTDERRSGG